MRVLFLSLAICGCGSVSRDQPDAAGIDSSGDATLARCDVTKPFGVPVPVDGVDTSSHDNWGWLSTDQLTIYFARGAIGDPNADLYFGTRTESTGSFNSIEPLTGVNTQNLEQRPTLTADGLTLFLEASSTGSGDIYVATRTSTAANFSAYVSVAVINTASIERNPWISEDGLVMYFASNRSGSFDIFKSTRSSTNSPFSTPLAVGELNTSTTDDSEPVASKDGLEIFFGSTRGQGGTNPVDHHIFHATRSTTSDGFGTPTQIMEPSSTNSEYPNWLSADRCQLIFTSNRTEGKGGWDLWIATRPR